MHKAKANNNNINRRIAFRVYEQVNLFYRPIDPNQGMDSPTRVGDGLSGFIRPATAQPAYFDSADSTRVQVLPNSESQENDTLNVNISASGIAFTCKEGLTAGDYLMLRILLLSSMTTIMTCCQVVYCKPSNPYENDRYPFLIGAQFVNLTANDRALLNEHVSKQKTRQRVTYGLLLSLALAVLSFPDLMLGLLLDLGDHVMELTSHLLHLLFEFLEYNLDHLVEHTFHTDLHQTQLIVFYLLLALGLAMLYACWRIIPPLCVRFGNSQLAFWSRKKASLLYYWGEQTLLDKFKLIGAGIVAITCYVLFGI